MSDEIDPLVIQRTQQKLGKYVQRPQLTDKLLRRPPFRFLHDIITAVISQYGVLDNVFTKQELVSDNIKEKEEKIAFLQKFISHLSSELGQDLNVKPSKIVAGIEVEKTNQLLQALALILENKHNTKSQHKPTIAHESKSNGVSTPTKATGKTNSAVNSKQSNVIKKGIPTTKENTSKTIVKSEAKQTTVKAKDSTKAAGIGIKPTTNKTATVPTSKVTTKNEETKGNKDSASASKKPDNKPIKTTPSNVTAKMSSRNQKDTSPASRTLGKLQPSREVIFDESPADIPPDFSNVSEEPVKDTAAMPHDDIVSDEKTSQISPDFPSADSGITIEHTETVPLNNKSRPMKSSAAQDEGLGVDDVTDTRESSGNLSNRIGQLSPPQSSNLNAFEKPLSERSSSPNVPHKRPPSGNRPKSSRRPPSRTIRDRLSVIPQDSRPLSSQVPKVIIEGNAMSDDEEDRIVQAAVFDQATADLSQAGANELLGGEQGKLVEQILSAQKEWDPTADMEMSSIDSSSSAAQVQHLKAMIQEMAQAALPLGQLIPLIHEDMEIVQQEWQFWKKEADMLEEEYHKEKSSINSGFEKLQTELDQLNRVVLEHQEKLNMTKASVLRTEKDVSLVISNFGKKR